MPVWPPQNTGLFAPPTMPCLQCGCAIQVPIVNTFIDSADGAASAYASAAAADAYLLAFSAGGFAAAMDATAFGTGGATSADINSIAGLVTPTAGFISLSLNNNLTCVNFVCFLKAGSFLCIFIEPGSSSEGFSVNRYGGDEIPPTTFALGPPIGTPPTPSWPGFPAFTALNKRSYSINADGYYWVAWSGTFSGVVPQIGITSTDVITFCGVVAACPTGWRSPLDPTGDFVAWPQYGQVLAPMCMQFSNQTTFSGVTSPYSRYTSWDSVDIAQPNNIQSYWAYNNGSTHSNAVNLKIAINGLLSGQDYQVTLYPFTSPIPPTTRNFVAGSPVVLTGTVDSTGYLEIDYTIPTPASGFMTYMQYDCTILAIP